MIKNKIHPLQLLTLALYIFIYTPTLVMIVFSFNQQQFPSPWAGFSLNWYIDLFQNKELWQAAYTSFLVAFWSTTLSALLSIGLIFYTARGGKIKKFLPIFYGNYIFPETVFAVGFLTFILFINLPLGLSTLILAHLVLALGIFIPLTYHAYKEIDPLILEASMDLGAPPLYTFFHITIPLLYPVLTTTALLVFVNSFEDFLLAYFCAGNSVQTLSLYIFSKIRTGVSPVLNALFTLLFSASSLLAFLYLYFQKRNLRIP